MINGNALYALSPSRLRIAVCPQPRSEWSARSEARTNDLDGGQNVGGQLGLPAGAREEGAAITEGDRTPLGRCAVVPRRSMLLCLSRVRVTFPWSHFLGAHWGWCQGLLDYGQDRVGPLG